MASACDVYVHVTAPITDGGSPGGNSTDAVEVTHPRRDGAGEALVVASVERVRDRAGVLHPKAIAATPGIH